MTKKKNDSSNNSNDEGKFMMDGTTPRRPVIVCTAHRGVFFGYTENDILNDEVISLYRARCAIQFGTTKGVLELCETGPTPRSKIGARAPAIHLRNITAVFDVSEGAVKAWEEAKAE